MDSFQILLSMSCFLFHWEKINQLKLKKKKHFHVARFLAAKKRKKSSFFIYGSMAVYIVYRKVTINDKSLFIPTVTINTTIVAEVVLLPLALFLCCLPPFRFFSFDNWKVYFLSLQVRTCYNYTQLPFALSSGDAVFLCPFTRRPSGSGGWSVIR